MAVGPRFAADVVALAAIDRLPSVGRCRHPPHDRAVGSRERMVASHAATSRPNRTFARAISGKVHEYGLTPPQFGILEALHHLGPLPLGELAEKLLVTGGNVTYVMDRLEAQGLVQRCRSEEDRRVVTAVLTPEGRDLVAAVFPEHATFIAGLMSALDVREQDELRELLKRLGKGIGES